MSEAKPSQAWADNDKLAHVKPGDPAPEEWDHDNPICNQLNDDGMRVCIRETGHVGQHIAWGVSYVLAVWPQAEAAVLTDGVTQSLNDRIIDALNKQRVTLTAARSALYGLTDMIDNLRSDEERHIDNCGGDPDCSACCAQSIEHIIAKNLGLLR